MTRVFIRRYHSIKLNNSLKLSTWIVTSHFNLQVPECWITARYLWFKEFSGKDIWHFTEMRNLKFVQIIYTPDDKLEYWEAPLFGQLILLCSLEEVFLENQNLWRNSWVQISNKVCIITSMFVAALFTINKNMWTIKTSIDRWMDNKDVRYIYVNIS